MSITFAPALRRDNCIDMTVAPDGPDLNVSNRNGFLLLTELGLEPDYCGDMDAQELLALISLRQAFPSGISLETIEERGDAGARMIDFGVAPDYVPTRLRQLAVVAEAAARMGGVVAWA